MAHKYVPILCAIPFIGIALWLLAGKHPENLLTMGLVFACPLSHLLLMRHDGHTHQETHADEDRKHGRPPPHSGMRK